MRIELPYPPTGNLYWRHWRGRVVTSPVAKRYRSMVQSQAKVLGLMPLSGPVVVSVAIHRPAKRGDLDNSLKVLLDALRGVAFVDDSQVEELHAYRHESKANPRAVVRVDAVPNWRGDEAMEALFGVDDGEA